jgi:hypothetical protein
MNSQHVTRKNGGILIVHPIRKLPDEKPELSKACHNPTHPLELRELNTRCTPSN